MHVFRPRTDLARVLLFMAPLIGAGLIAISRLEDYRHDAYDVTCGSALGMAIAYFSYRRYYPCLESRHCHQAYPSRETTALQRADKMRDEEQQRPEEEQDSRHGFLDEDDSETLPLTSVREHGGASHVSPSG